VSADIEHRRCRKGFTDEGHGDSSDFESEATAGGAGAWERSAVSPYESCVLGKCQLRGIRIIIHLLWCGYLEAT
jgi:hypothetical protein